MRLLTQTSSAETLAPRSSPLPQQLYNGILSYMLYVPKVKIYYNLYMHVYIYIYK